MILSEQEKNRILNLHITSKNVNGSLIREDKAGAISKAKGDLAAFAAFAAGDEEKPKGSGGGGGGSSTDGPSAKSNETASLSDELIIEIINGTISAGGSKNYTDLFLDSNGDTAVGILHFTKRGLKKLYEAMDTEKYFKQSEADMIKSIDTYKGDEMNHADWKKAMTTFLNSDESEMVQNKAATAKFKNGLATPIQKGGWTTPREYAVGMFYLNSYPKCLGQMGAKYNWDAEQMLKAYCSGECSAVSACRSRCNHINKSYPMSASAEGYSYQGC